MSDVAKAYTDAILDHPLMRQWIADATQEQNVQRERNDRLSKGGYLPGDWPILKR